MIPLRPSRLACAALLCTLGLLDPSSLPAQTVQPVPAGRVNLTATVYQEGGALVFVRADRSAAEPLNGWNVPGRPAGDLVGLVRPSATGTDLRVLNADGRQVGAFTLPAGRVPIVTDAGVVTLVEALHVPVRPHEIGFYAIDGMRRRLVEEPGLALVKYTPLRDGRLVTVNQGPAADDRAVLVYGPDGTVRWRYDWKGTDIPDVIVTPDTARLVLVHQDVLAGTSAVTVLEPGNRVMQTHMLPVAYQAVSSDDSQRVAVVGQSVVAMLDAASGRLVWRTDMDIDLVLAGGLRFDPASGRLLIVSAQRDRRAGRANLRLRSFDAGNGTAASADLGTLALDEAPPVLAVDTTPAGQRRVLLQDRGIETAPEQ